LAEVDRGMTAKLEGPTDSHSLALIGGSKGKANSNPSTRMFSFSSLMSMPNEDFDELGEDELALLTRRFERLHEYRVNMRRNTRTCFQCGKPRHFVADCPEKVENKNGYKHKPRNDGKYRSRRDHKSKHKNKYKDKRRSRKKESRGKTRAMAGARASNGYPLYIRLRTLTCGSDTFFLNDTCFPQQLGPIKKHLKINKNMKNS
jgi:hypothetical protein